MDNGQARPDTLARLTDRYPTIINLSAISLSHIQSVSNQSDSWEPCWLVVVVVVVVLVVLLQLSGAGSSLPGRQAEWEHFAVILSSSRPTSHFVGFCFLFTYSTAAIYPFTPSLPPLETL